MCNSGPVFFFFFFLWGTQSYLHFQVDAKCRRGEPYNKGNLLRAYEATKSGISVYRAARVYSVPESTLRGQN